MNSFLTHNAYMKILLLDIETSPNTAHVWGLFQQNIGLNQLLDSSYTLCWAAKWYQEPEVFFESVYRSGPKKMLKGVHKLLDEADVVIHYNGTKFDIPTLNKEFILYKMNPPAPFKQIDLLKVARNRFRFPSNRLDYVASALGFGSKKHTTHELWIKCMNNDSSAWKEMEEYNKHDVVLLEHVYERFKPWIRNHPNHNLYSEGEVACPNCGNSHFQKRGFCYTAAFKYQRFQCLECGNWFRSSKCISRNAAEKVQTIKGD